MERLNITKGNWEIQESMPENIRTKEKGLIATIFYGDSIFNKPLAKEEGFDNAKLIADAGTTYNIEPILPSELLKQRNELIECLENANNVLKMASLIDKSNTCDEAQKQCEDLIAKIKTT